MKKKILEHPEERNNNRKSKNLTKYKSFPSFEFSKLCLTVDTNIIILSQFSKYVEEILKTIALYIGEGKETEKQIRFLHFT